MDYYALSCLDDALEATKSFLLPFDRSQWLRLAAVVFFLAGGSGAGSAPSAGSNATPSLATDVPTDVPTSLLDANLLAIIAVGGAILTLGLLYTLVGAVMEFVLVDTLRTERVSVRETFRAQVRNGLSLFLFQLVLGLTTVGILGGVALLLALPTTGGGGVGLALGILAFVVTFLVVFLTAALANLLTVDFVVPTMLHEDRGLVASWKRLWPVLRRDVEQFVVYLLVRIGVAIAVGIVGGTLAGIVGGIIAVPFALVGGVVVFVTGFSLSPVVLALLGVLVAGYLLALFVAVALIHVPLKTYVRYYQLLVLGDADPALDLIARRRGDIRGTTA